MSEAEPSRVRPGEALRRLHDALPAWVNFTVGRSDPGWNVIVQVPEQYDHASTGTDLGAVVDEALGHFGQWAAKSPRPPKLTAPGATERRRRGDRQKDAS